MNGLLESGVVGAEAATAAGRAEYRTCSQSRAHFARHATRRPHTAQVLSSSILPAEPRSLGG